MKKIGDLLEKFAKLARSSDEAKMAVLGALTANGIKVADMQKVSIKGTTALLKLTPMQKSELFFKKKKILAALAENPLTKHITAVR